MEMEGIIREGRYALRQLARNRGFSVASTFTLVLGIGASTALFSLLDSWILRPLPLKDPEQLVEFWRAAPATPKEPAYYFSWRDYLYFRARTQAFKSLGASFERSYALTGSGAPLNLTGGVANSDFFKTLEATAYRGRLFSAEDLNGPPVAVLSYALWTTQFHRSQILGENVTLNEKSYKIIGVLPPEFSYRVLDQSRDAAVWTLIQPNDAEYKANSVAAVAIVGRLKSEALMNTAKLEISHLQSENDHQYSDLPQSTALLVGLHEDNTRTVKLSLFVLAGAVGLMLLIACTNTASLIVGRNLQREKEFAIRSALGCRLRHLLLQLSAESLILYGFSGLFGLLVAFGFVRGFVVWNPFGILPAESITVNVRVLLVSVLLTLLTAFVFGVYPATTAARVSINETLRSISLTVFISGGKIHARVLIVLTQIAFSVALLIGASLLLTTFFRLNAEPLGFKPADTAVVGLSLSHKRYASDAQLTQFSSRLLKQFREFPGVEAAGMTFSLNLGGGGTSDFQIASSRDVGEERLPQAVPVTCGPGYFQAMGIPLVRGREFRETDVETTQPVAVVNEEAVRRYFPTRDPIGEHIRIGDPKDADTRNHSWLEIVGIASSTKSVRYNQIAWDTRPEVFTDYRQQQIHQYAENWDYTHMFLVVRTRPGVTPTEIQIRNAVWDEDPDLPVGEIQSLESVVAGLQTQPRVRAQLLLAFAVLTLMLAAIGVYGVMTQSVGQRYREIGIRMALGANRKQMLLLVLKQAFNLTILGACVGVALAFVGLRLMSSLLYGIKSTSPTLYAGVVGVVAVVALVASFLPARRAASVDPARSLRTE